MSFSVWPKCTPLIGISLNTRSETLCRFLDSRCERFCSGQRKRAGRCSTDSVRKAIIPRSCQVEREGALGQRKRALHHRSREVLHPRQRAMHRYRSSKTLMFVTLSLSPGMILLPGLKRPKQPLSSLITLFRRVIVFIDFLKT